MPCCPYPQLAERAVDRATGRGASRDRRKRRRRPRRGTSADNLGRGGCSGPWSAPKCGSGRPRSSAGDPRPHGRPGVDAGPSSADALAGADAILDALIGYNLHGPPREPIAALIRAANRADAPVIALDIPSGLDGDSGEAYDPTITAATTITLALPKAGLMQPRGREWVGDLYLADISVPVQIYQRFGIETGSVFTTSDIVRVSLHRNEEPA